MTREQWYREQVREEIEKRGSRIKTPEKFLEREIERLKVDQAHWLNIMEHGCNDPFWTDGVNMNLTRRHIQQEKERIRAVCAEYHMQIPAVFYLPVPPEVPKNYMADVNPSDEHKKARLKRLLTENRTVTIRKPRMDAEVQLTFM